MKGRIGLAVAAALAQIPGVSLSLPYYGGGQQRFTRQRRNGSKYSPHQGAQEKARRCRQVLDFTASER
ncbi:hypothetical protein [Marinobacterium lutimaris]|uniref:Uncharacterized protein n=1 Tax=Marinobacterium lutimaris TaxID=568106 RepID=A0A1H5YBP5_9GAMM|nr:hypothetical protein [Marinobacterium lutimaris]SEG21182.1 hypothetical protein SAMN05444390_1011687 [Marinobacterium lutimaris]